jgi:hypothetical protein
MMFKHYTVFACIDGEDIGYLFDAIDDLLPPVLTTYAGNDFHSAEKNVADTA